MKRARSSRRPLSRILEGKPFEKGKAIENANIIDIAPTVAKLLDTEPNDTWEGKSLI